MHHLYDCNRCLFYQSPFEREVVYWMSAPPMFCLTPLKHSLAKEELPMQRPNKARAINYFLHVKMQGSELQSTFWESCWSSKGCSRCSLNKTYTNLLNISSWKVKGKAVVTQQQRFCSKSSFLSLWQRPASSAGSRSAVVCLDTVICGTE